MTRVSLFILSFFIFKVVNSQLTLTKANNGPVAGYVYALNYYDSTMSIPKITGLNRHWNFTSMNFTGTSFSTYTYQTASSTPFASTFPGANIALTSGGSSYNYFNSQANHIEETGFVSGSYHIVYSDPMTTMIWPLTYGNSNSDAFDATETGTLAVNFNGVMTVSASGTGTVTLPSGQKFNNCLQVIRTHSFILTYPASDTYTINYKTYEYWTSMYRNPIISIEYSSIKESTETSKDIVIFTNRSADVGVEEQKDDEILFIVYPNPVKDKLNVLLKDNSVADKLELYDATGRLMLSGENTNSLNTSSLNKGVYLLQVKRKDSRFAKQIIITE